jgi:hypothetical protein
VFIIEFEWLLTLSDPYSSPASAWEDLKDF